MAPPTRAARPAMARRVEFTTRRLEVKLAKINLVIKIVKLILSNLLISNAL